MIASMFSVIWVWLEGLGLFLRSEFLGVGVFAFGQLEMCGRDLIALFGETGVVAIDLFAVLVHGAAVINGLFTGGFALFGDVSAVGVVLSAVFVGEDAEEVLEQCGAGFWGGGES